MARATEPSANRKNLTPVGLVTSIDKQASLPLVKHQTKENHETMPGVHCVLSRHVFSAGDRLFTPTAQRNDVNAGDDTTRRENGSDSIRDNSERTQNDDALRDVD